MRTSIAGNGLTEPNIYFASLGAKCKSSPVTGTISSVHNGLKLWALDFSFQLVGLRRRNPMLVIVWDNLDILHLHFYNDTIPKKRGDLAWGSLDK
jgi:hypothetical protein